MKIVHITSVHPEDDMRILRKQAASQAQLGWDVHLVALDKSSTSASMENKFGVTIHRIPGHRIAGRLQRSTLGAWRVSRQAAYLSPDIVTAHDPELIPFLALLRLRGVKPVFDAHEDFVMQNQSKTWTAGYKRHFIVAYSRLLRLIAKRTCWKILAATEGVAKPYPAEKTLVIKNLPIAGELGETDPAKISQRPKRLVYVGGLSEVRGIREIITAAGLCKTLDGLDLAGPFETPAFEAEMKSLSGWRKVAYHGMQDRDGVARLLANARGGLVTLHPTPNHLHSIPIKMMEYFSVGLPAIASNFPYWSELIEDGITGFLVDPLDVEAISSRMTETLDDDQCAKMVAAVKSGPRIQYDWKTQADLLNSTLASAAPLTSR